MAKTTERSQSGRAHRLYLVRHAIAPPRGPEWPDDAKRPLTLKGIARMKKAVKGLRALGVDVDLVATSPLVRARQTADLVAAGLRKKLKTTVLPALAPGQTPAAVAKALAPLARARRIALVGHEPGLGQLAAWLTGARTPLPFRKGGVARIDVPSWPPSGTGSLVWFATPRMLRRLR